MKRCKWIATLTSVLWLVGCATSSPPANRYTLPAGPLPAASAGTQAEHRLQVRTPRLAHYLDVDGIVLQLDDITLNEARGHQWAEPLPRQLDRNLRARLAARLPDTRILRGDEPSRGTDLTLHLDIDRFQGRFDGQAVVEGQWQLRNAEGELSAMDTFSITTQLAEDGYPALVRALGESWERLAEQIAEAIRRQR